MPSNPVDGWQRKADEYVKEYLECHAEDEGTAAVVRGHWGLVLNRRAVQETSQKKPLQKRG